MKVFVAGSRTVRSITKDVQQRLSSILAANGTVLVGDAKGADLLVQKFLHEKMYRSVIVYSSGGRIRNNVGAWKVAEVNTEQRPGTFEFYAAKDKKMSEDADYGFMIWDGKSKGTLNDIMMLTEQKKPVLVYYLPLKKFISVQEPEKLKSFVSACGDEAMTMYNGLLAKKGSKKAVSSFPSSSDENRQISIFDMV